MRTAISRARLVARDSSRLATFAHAISSTNATAPISDRNTVRIGPPFMFSLNVWTVRLDVLVGVGILCLELLRDVDQLALRLLARHAGREMAEHLQRPLSCASASRDSASCSSGSQRSVFNGNLKPSGITPMIMAGTSLMRTVRPITDGLLTVAVLPHAVADQHHRLRAGPVVVGHEVAAEHRTDAEDLEAVGGDVRAGEALGRLAFVADVGASCRCRRRATRRSGSFSRQSR